MNILSNEELEVIMKVDDQEWSICELLTDVRGFIVYKCCVDGNIYHLPEEYYDENKTQEENVLVAKRRNIIRKLKE